jgi:3-oxoadipate enol-lactonase
VQTAPRFARCDGLSICYGELGSGPPVLFLHGIGSTRHVWDQQLAGLSDRFRCLAFDYRGYGQSQRPPSAALQPGARDAASISLYAFARDAIAVLDAAGIAAAHLCGLSLGGVVALECYARFAPRIKSLTLCDTFAFYPGGEERVRERIAARDALGRGDPAVSEPAGAPNDKAAAEALSEAGAVVPEVYKAATRATWTGDYRALLPSIAVPALVIWGSRDLSVTPFALSADIARWLPHCRGVTVIPGAGHVSNLDNPAAFNAALASFLQAAEAGA